jgi:hypothetical protein
VTNIEFLIRTAHALVSVNITVAMRMLTRAAAETVDPRLRHWLRSALVAFEDGDCLAAQAWLTRAARYAAQRLKDRS